MFSLVAGHMYQPYRALMILAQGLAQYAVQRPQAGAGRQQPQRLLLPVRVITQCPATQLAQAHHVTGLELPRRVNELTGVRTIEVKLQKAVFFGQARQ